MTNKAEGPPLGALPSDERINLIADELFDHLRITDRLTLDRDGFRETIGSALARAAMGAPPGDTPATLDHVECAACGAYYRCHQCDEFVPEIHYVRSAPPGDTPTVLTDSKIIELWQAYSMAKTRMTICDFARSIETEVRGQRAVTDAFGLDANGRLSTEPRAAAKRAELINQKAGSAPPGDIPPSPPDFAELEREHFGDPDKKTGVYSAERCGGALAQASVGEVRWTNVDVERPEPDRKVLCWDGDRWFLAYLSSNEKRWDEWRYSNNGLLVDCITHWMPLPEPPQVAELPEPSQMASGNQSERSA